MIEIGGGRRSGGGGIGVDSRCVWFKKMM